MNLMNQSRFSLMIKFIIAISLIIIIPIIFIVLLLFGGMIATKIKSDVTRRSIYYGVEKNAEDIISYIRNENYEELTNYSFIKNYRLASNEDGSIDVFVYSNGIGIAPSSTEYGFYYSESNSPRGFHDTEKVKYGVVQLGYDFTDNLKPKNKGWFYREGSSDNTYYTEMITDYLYYYKATN